MEWAGRVPSLHQAETQQRPPSQAHPPLGLLTSVLRCTPALSGFLPLLSFCSGPGTLLGDTFWGCGQTHKTESPSYYQASVSLSGK